MTASNLADSTARLAKHDASADPVAARIGPYVSRILLQHLVHDPESRHWSGEGTAAFVDISGFTRLSEALARKGREGAEHIADTIGRIFESMLSITYANGGSLLKFGGDSLLLWFDGEQHGMRACRVAVLMRDHLAEAGRIAVDDTSITLRMSQGVHSGHFHFFMVGTEHYEMLPVGPAWTRLVDIQHGADPDEIAISADNASHLPPECVGPGKSDAFLLMHEPAGEWNDLPLRSRPALPAEILRQCLPSAIRIHSTTGGGSSEHRPVTIAFIRFEGTDALIADEGPAAAAASLHRVVSVVESACARHDVAFLATDVDSNGGKIILTGGAPKVTGNDEERVLLALRAIIQHELPLPVRIGVHRGAVFAGDIGPRYRRTYTVMGDAVNLSARLMAKAERGAIYATADVLERSRTHFQTTELPPFAVKGKAEPVKAWSVGEAQSSRTRQTTTQKLPLTGRNAELGVLRKAFTNARSGAGRLIEIVGEAGVGKTRLLEALRDAAAGFKKLRATCEAYTASKPYALWSEVLREYLEMGRDDSDEVVADRLRETIAARAPGLEPWLPLIATVFDVDLVPTPEIQMLADANRRKRLHESVGRFLETTLDGSVLIEIEDAHHLDEASSELLAYLTDTIVSRPWLIAVARRPTTPTQPSEKPSISR